MASSALALLRPSPADHARRRTEVAGKQALESDYLIQKSRRNCSSRQSRCTPTALVSFLSRRQWGKAHNVLTCCQHFATPSYYSQTPRRLVRESSTDGMGPADDDKRLQTKPWPHNRVALHRVSACIQLTFHSDEMQIALSRKDGPRGVSRG